jgi:pyrroloquinoline-quinone synthase
MSSVQTALDSIVAKWNLNTHPFYEAWRAGTLPQETLRYYAEEYGQLVRLMPSGWATLNSPALVQEEEDHSVMWDSFAQCLDTKVPAGASLPETAQMVETVRRLFSQPETALGALYAFEVQQPETATSKLEGLKEFYPNLDPNLYTEYFEVHSRNHHESAEILELMAGRDQGEQAQWASACEEMCQTLWNALTGIHNTGMCSGGGCPHCGGAKA